MKILHTSDWHVGKVLKGQSRYDEHKAVLAQVVEIAQAERPDLVLVAGDLYDTAAPSPQAVRLVVRALKALSQIAESVVVVGGNHDNGAALDALRPWAEAAGITLRGSVRDPDEHIIDGRPPAASAGRWWRCRSCRSVTPCAPWRCTTSPPPRRPRRTPTTSAG